MLDRYSPAVRNALERQKIGAGDRIRVEKDGVVHEGVLMPKSAGDPDLIVLKLDSGYNAGIAPGAITLVRKHVKGADAKKLSFDKTKPPVSIIATGGTITSKVDYATGGVRALAAPEELLANIPELLDIVDVRAIERPFTKMSEDMEPADWAALAVPVARELNKDNRGVIVTHGTDTLHFTSAALSFMLRNLTKPVVLVGAQRSADRGSTDAAMNLICACHAALSDIAEVGICMHGTMNDDYCLFNRGTTVRKMHTSRRDAFRPINDMPLAKVWPSGSMEIINERHRKRRDGNVVADTAFEERIALLKAYPGSDPSVLEHFVQKGCRGFVVEGTALGHVPVNSKKSWIGPIRSIIERGVPVVITTQSLYGEVNPFVYSNLRILAATGAIFGGSMLPETAYVKLGWVLGREAAMDGVRTAMLTDVAGELAERIDPRAFLI